MTDRDETSAPHAPLPVALVALTVAGQCKERSPVDIAVFGERGERFADRFADAALAQSLLARAIADGAAEGPAELHTGAGLRPFRVSLWRQRGGDRVRILAALAEEGPSLPAMAAPHAARPAAGTQSIGRLGHELTGPLRTIIALSEGLRDRADAMEPADVASGGADIMIASWRLMRLVQDVLLVGERALDLRPSRVREVDVLHLLRRVSGLAAAQARPHDVTIAEVEGAAAAAAVHAFLDEDVLWGVVEDLIGEAVLAAGRGGTVETRLRDADDGGIEIEIASAPAETPDVGPRKTPGNQRLNRRGTAFADGGQIAMLRDLLAESGATLRDRSGESGGAAWVIGVPATSCVPAL